MIVALAVAAAFAAEPYVVLPNDTVEHIAETLGDPTLAEAIRTRNQLEAGAQPRVGTVLMLPDTAETTPQDAALLSWSGTLRLQVAGATTPPYSGLALPDGSSVCTDDNSFATVRLASTPTQHDDLSLLPKTCVTIDAVSARAAERRSLVTLAEGSITTRDLTGDLATNGQIAVRSASGLTAGKGGGFRVSIEADAARTEALGHGVDVLGAGERVQVPAGYGARVQTSQAPQQPVKLLGATSALRPDAGAELIRPDFGWTPVDRALGYRVQIASDADFANIQRSEDVPGADWTPELLLLDYRVDGLWWRVSAFDRSGFEGFASDARALRLPKGVGP